MYLVFLTLFFIAFFAFALRLFVAIQGLKIGRVNAKSYVIDPDETRDLMISGIINLRDLGQIKTRDGGTIKRSILYRSAHLHEGGNNDFENFVGKLNSVIDLRSPSEQAHLPDKVEGTKHLSRPIKRNDQSLLAIITPLIFQRRRLSSMMAHYYPNMLKTCAPAFGEAIRPLAKPESLPCLYHCLAGKDRTGLVIALILSICDVDFDIIVRDYSQTNRQFKHLMKDQYRGFLIRFFLSKRDIAPIVIADPQWLRNGFAYIEKQFGSVKNYLTAAAGLSNEELMAIKSNLVAYS